VLACIPVVLVFERLHWEDAILHITSFLACCACAVSALMYVQAGRTPGAGYQTNSVVYKLACLVILLTAAAVLTLGVFFVLAARMMRDFDS
jgi:hypothetical protein